MSDFTAAIAKDAEQRRAYVGKAEILEGLGRRDEAIGAYDALLKRSPDDVDALVAVTGLHRQAGAYDKAAQRLETALKLAPKDGDVSVERVKLRRDRGDKAGGDADTGRAEALQRKS